MAKKIRVLEMIDDATIGGGQVHVLMLAKHLDHNTFEVSIACKEHGFLTDEARKHGIEVIPVSMDNHLSLKTFLATTRILRQSNFDILHTHGGTAGFWGRMCGVFAGRPRIRIHSYHGMHYLSKHNVSSFRLQMTDRFLLCLSDKVVCVCESDFKKGLQAGIVTAKKGVIIHNGIEAKNFRDFKRRDALRAEFGLKESDILFGNVGRLHRQKGQRYLIDAFQKVKNKNPQAELWIVGEGELREELKKGALDSGVYDSVHFLGARTDIPEILSAIDIFVLPSLWEGQPITILEALAAGKAVIATNVDGIADILVNEKNALLVPPKDSHALSVAMNKMIQDRELRARISSAAINTMSEKFTAERMAGLIGELYQKTYSMRFGK